MIKVLRALVAAFGAFVALFFLATMLSIFAGLGDEVSTAASLPAALAAGWYAWRTTAGESVGVGVAMLGGALVVGGLGLAVGFLVPALLDPGANQGPLLGIFITGPLGVVAGAVGGYLLWVKNKKGGRR